MKTRVAQMGWALRNICIFLVGVLWFCGATAGVRLPEHIRPTQQVIELNLDPAAREFSGQVHVELSVAEPARTITFHCAGPTLERVELADARGALPQTHVQIDSQHVAVTPETELRPGNYLLDLSFHNTFDTQAVSLYRVETEGRDYLFSQMEEDEARKAFPCWDEPGFKFPYQVILNVPESLLAISNTPIVSETHVNGSKRVVFARSRPMPSYLLAFAVGPFDTVAIPGMSIPGRVVTVRGKGYLADEAVRSTPPILAALERYFDAPYPYAKLDLIAAPEFWPGAMENPGAIVFAEGLLLPDPSAITVRQKGALATTTAHELAHMWFGDLVTMAWWDDLWLNESFATWMGDKIVQEVSPDYEVGVSSVERMQGVLSGDARPSARAVRQPIEETSDLLGNIGVVYRKGQAVLNMFEQWVGEETFRAGVLAYLKQHAWGSATAADLWAALRDASGRDVGRAMSTFIDQPGVPLVDVVANGSGAITFRQRRMTNYGVESPPFQPWFIPIRLIYRAGGVTGERTIELTDTAMTVNLATDGPLEYILPHADARGYYRWSVPPDMLRELAENSIRIMTPRERIGFLGNLSGLLDAGVIGGDLYLEATRHFGADPNPQVVSAVLSALEKVERAFVTDDQKEGFAGYIRATLGPALARFGLETAPGELESVALVRPRLVAWLADEGADPDARAYIDTLFRHYMADAHSVGPDLITVAVALGCRDGDQALFDLCRQRFESATVPTERGRFLTALGCFKDRDLQEQALRYALEGPIRPQEVLDIPESIAAQSDKDADRIYRWMETNYAVITGKIPPVYKSFLPFFAGGCSRVRFEAARAFFALPEHHAPGIEIRMARVEDQVSDCAALRDREGGHVAEYLAAFADGPPEPPATGR